MRKVLFNKYVKLVELLCILFFAGLMLYKGIQIAGVWKDNAGQKDLLKEDIIDNLSMSEYMYEEIAPYINNLILAHEKGGMEGLEAETTVDKWENVHVTAADAEYIFFDNLRTYRIDERLWYVDESQRKTFAKEKVENELENYIFNIGCSILLNENVVYTLYDGEEKHIFKIEYADILSEGARQYMQNIDNQLSISMYTTYDYVCEVEKVFWDEYYNELDNLYEVEKEEFVISRIPEFVVCGVCILLATILLVISCGRCVEEKKVLNKYEMGYTEIHLIIICGLVAALGVGGYFFYTLYGEFPYHRGSSELKAINISFIAVMLLGVLWLYYELGIILKKFINKRFLKDWCIVRILIRIKKWLGKKIHKAKAIFKETYDSSSYVALPSIKKAYIRKIITDVLVTLMLLILFILGVVVPLEEQPSNDLYYYVGIVIIVLLIIYYIGIFFEYKKLREFNRVVEAIDTIYGGNYDGVKLVQNESSEEMLKLADLSHSFEESVQKQVEAEKLQVELVANVSHDLKTPLTSIISYVDLLKEEEMSEIAKDYVKVLVDKSARLKDIVADVFDLAKATSGEQVTMEQLDGVVLINQVLSDMSDRIEESGRDLRVKVQTETAPITGNGQKLYRVFQNVIDNALKYSMPGTRIHIASELKNDEFVVTIKNISEFEIDYTAEQIMSRFTRGDKARNSEGNGLGLSIAKSFTELCGGNFEVKIDDDVFMVVIRLT